MLINLLAQVEATAQSRSEFIEFMSSLDPDTVGVMLILTVIGFFVGSTVVLIVLIEARKSVKLAKIQQEMVEDLVNRGFSPEEIHKLVRGENGWDKFCGLFQRKNKESNHGGYRPVPPVKQSA